EAGNELPGGDQWTPMTQGTKKVQVGDSWHQTYDRPFSGGEGVIHEDDLTQFVRWDTVKKAKPAVVQTNYSIDNLDVALSFRKLFQQCGCQLPPKVDPRMAFKGKVY